MQSLHANTNIKEGYSNIQVSIHRPDNGEDKITWRIYAYDSKQDTSGSKWSEECETFELALENIVSLFEKNRKPKSEFVE